MGRFRGRGGSYAPARGLVEAALRLAFHRGWPARAWSRVPGATRVRPIELVLPLLPAGSAPLRIAFLSDIHIGPTTPHQTTTNAARLLQEMAPDVLVLGGDYVFLDATPRRAEILRELIASIPARHKVGVWGNHDLWTDHGLLERALQEAGVHMLVNDALRLPEPHGSVALLGLDEPWTGRPDVDAALAACGDATLRLAVAHAPSAMPMLQGRGVALLMCGHTHGGQIALPGGIPIVAPGVGSRTWPHGRYEVDGTTLFVSRGVGGVEVPVRSWAPPDVVLFRIVGVG